MGSGVCKRWWWCGSDVLVSWLGRRWGQGRVNDGGKEVRGHVKGGGKEVGLTRCKGWWWCGSDVLASSLAKR